MTWVPSRACGPAPAARSSISTLPPAAARGPLLPGLGRRLVRLGLLDPLPGRDADQRRTRASASSTDRMHRKFADRLRVSDHRSAAEYVDHARPLSLLDSLRQPQRLHILHGAPGRRQQGDGVRRRHLSSPGTVRRSIRLRDSVPRRSASSRSLPLWRSPGHASVSARRGREAPSAATWSCPRRSERLAERGDSAAQRRRHSRGRRGPRFDLALSDRDYVQRAFPPLRRARRENGPRRRYG